MLFAALLSPTGVVMAAIVATAVACAATALTAQVLRTLEKRNTPVTVVVNRTNVP